jgi:hypothetical protein
LIHAPNFGTDLEYYPATNKIKGSMKTYNQPAVNKLLTRFDNELKTLITKDLKSFMIKNQFLARNKQAAIQATLSIA